MRNEDFVPAFILGMVSGIHPACSQVESLDIDPSILAGLCVSLIDAVISKLPDSKQVDFEHEASRLIDYMIENRHAYVSTRKIKEEE